MFSLLKDQMSNSNLGYRPEIDGLRAIAVLSVLVFHSEKGWLPGGFLGVDIFLVISGFLIGRILLQQVLTGDMSAPQFIQRRIKRLAPEFLVMLLLSSLVAFVLMPPYKLAQFGEFLLYAIMGASNMRFAFGDTYFEIPPDSNPLLHTWSLGLEEQFYLAALLLTLWARKISISRNQLRLGLAGLSVFSFLIAIATPVFFSDQLNFYWLPSRAWEFGVGILVAEAKSTRFYLAGRQPSRVLASGVGLGTLIFSIAALGDSISGPSWLSLLPVGGVALVLWNLDGASQLKILGTLPFRFIGSLSYGIYIWHYPIFTFGRMFSPFAPNTTWLFLIPVVVMFAFLSNFLLGQRFRSQEFTFSKSLTLTSILLLVATFGTASVVTSGIPARASGLPQAEADTLPEGPHIVATGKSGNRLILVGDSHMAALGPGIVNSLTSSDLTIASFTMGACPFIDGVELVHKVTFKVSRGCDIDLQRERIEWVNSFGPSTVVIDARWTAYLVNSEGPQLTETVSLSYYLRAAGESNRESRSSVEKILSRLQVTIDDLEEHGHRIVLVYPIPEPQFNVPDALLREYLMSGARWPLPKPVELDAKEQRELAETATQTLDRLVMDGYRFRPYDSLCALRITDKCSLHSDTEIYFYDTNHLSSSGANLIGAQISNLVKDSFH